MAEEARRMAFCEIVLFVPVVYQNQTQQYQNFVKENGVAWIQESLHLQTGKDSVDPGSIPHELHDLLQNSDVGDYDNDESNDHGVDHHDDHDVDHDDDHHDHHRVMTERDKNNRLFFRKNHADHRDSRKINDPSGIYGIRGTSSLTNTNRMPKYTSVTSGPGKAKETYRQNGQENGSEIAKHSLYDQHQQNRREKRVVADADAFQLSTVSSPIWYGLSADHTVEIPASN